LLTLTIALLSASGAPTAWARTAPAAALKVVRYHGYTVRVPRAWPVYHLTRGSTTCVRFDRHALYLGDPSSRQRCPAHAAGRTEAILVAPAGAPAPGKSPRSAPLMQASLLAGRSTSFLVGSARVAVTATWSHDQGLVARALDRRALPAAVSASPAAGSRTVGPRSASPKAQSASAVYTGSGFDACSTPSSGAMSAWGASPYRALGVYIGGTNAACSQPNLTSSWVANQIAAGWHLIPTYVGLQAPSNSCGCASITPAQASAQGTAAANDAVSNAQAVSIPIGNPIYFDMEAYSRGGTNTSSVMAFLSAWTSRLHALGYLSGVYSSSGSGMSDLAARSGTSFVEPDDIWFAEWNGSPNTASAYVPAADWPNHQRIHQYRGAHNETYGGVTINIDGDYLDGATADNSSASATDAPTTPTTPPVLGVAPASNGLTNFSASWSGAIGVRGWRVLGGESSSSMAGIGSGKLSGAVTHLGIRTAAPYFAVQALGSSNQILGTSVPVPTPPHLAIFGKTAFVPALTGGLGGLPVGCYTGHLCLLSTTLTVGRTLVARTGPEPVGSGAGGIAYFHLTPTGTNLLLRARSHHLAVTALVHDVASGQNATAPLSLVAFVTSGHAAVARQVVSPTLRVAALSNFVPAHGAGGILAGCGRVPLCSVTTTLTVGPTVIAHTGPEIIGADELGTLIFNLTSRGRTLLGQAKGNNLLAHLTLATPTTRATANISLVQFH
jgi:hypothetical protein